MCIARPHLCVLVILPFPNLRGTYVSATFLHFHRLYIDNVLATSQSNAVLVALIEIEFPGVSHFSILIFVVFFSHLMLVTLCVRLTTFNNQIHTELAAECERPMEAVRNAEQWRHGERRREAENSERTYERP